MAFSLSQKNNIPKDYKIPLDYIPKATVSKLMSQSSQEVVLLV